MATRRGRLTDEELRALCEQEITSASTYSADLTEERADAMDAYLGQPYGNEVEHRSSVVTREVLDTVEWVLPSLLRIFSDADNMLRFEPTGPEDDEAAAQETEAVAHAFWKQNRGFHNLYGFIKDGLLQKTGILKVYWDDAEEEEREEYQGLTDWEISQIFNDPAIEVVDLIHHEQRPDGLHDLTFLGKRAKGEVRIEPCPPEEFGINRDARSIYPDDADFLFHRTRMSKSDLVEMGFDRSTVLDLPHSNEDVTTRERLARRHLSDEREDYEYGDHWSMEKVWITECYIRVDRDADGVAELLKVTLAGQDSNYANGATLLDVEEVDRQPFVVWSPFLLTHKFFGLSLADLVMDLQLIKTTLTRNMLDNVYQANNARMAANERVNLDDLLTSRPMGIVRTEGTDPPGSHLFPIPQQPLPPQTFEMQQYLDEMRQRRTGVGDEVGALEGNALAQVNTGVAAMAYDASRAKIELMARLCAEIGLRPLFLRIHELMRKHSERDLPMRLRGQWVQVRPQAWRERTDMTVQVGIGRVSRERRLIALSDVLEKQAAAVQGGGLGVLLMPEHMYQAVTDYTRELGLEESLYWMDPSQAPPQQQDTSQQDLAQAQLQIQALMAQAQRERNQVEVMKIQSGERVKALEIQNKQREAELKRQTDMLQADLARLEAEAKQANESSKIMLDTEIKARQQELQAASARLDDERKENAQMVDLYKALLQSSTTLTAAQMSALGIEKPVEQAPQAAGKALPDTVRALEGQVANLYEQLEQERAAKAKPAEPKLVKRDAEGRIVAIGDQPVRRDAQGLVVSIG